MMNIATKAVTLSAPITVFDKVYTEIVLKRPSASMFIELGAITSTFKTDGVEIQSDNPKVLRSYLERTIVNIPDASTVLEGVLRDATLADGLRLRRAITEFFNEAVDVILGELALAEPADEAATG